MEAGNVNQKEAYKKLTQLYETEKINSVLIYGEDIKKIILTTFVFALKMSGKAGILLRVHSYYYAQQLIKKTFEQYSYHYNINLKTPSEVSIFGKNILSHRWDQYNCLPISYDVSVYLKINNSVEHSDGVMFYNLKRALSNDTSQLRILIFDGSEPPSNLFDIQDRTSTCIQID